MRPIQKIAVVLLLALGSAGATPGALDVLGIGMGAASDAMGHAGVAAPASLEGLYLNPASLASMGGGLAIQGSFNPYLDMTLWGASLSFTSFRRFTVAGGVYGLSYGDMAGDIQFFGDAGRLLKNGDAIGQLSVGMPLGSLLGLPFTVDLGGSVKYAAQTLDDLSLSGFLFDVGALAAFQIKAAVLSVGLAVRDLGSISGSGTTLGAPSSLSAGAAFLITPAKVFSLKLLADVEASLDLASPHAHFGAEAALLDLIFLRGGYVLGEDTRATRGVTLGAGFRLRMGQAQVRIDYAAIPLGELGGLQHNVQLGANLALASKSK